MSAYGVAQFLQAAAHQRQALLHEAGVAEHYGSIHRQRRAELERAHVQAVADVGVVLLRELTPEWLDYAVRTTGLAALAAENPISMREAERQKRRQRLAQIEADPRFAQRELLRHPRTGSLPRGIAEMHEHLAPMEAILNACQHPRLDRLLQSGYGTPSYETGFWRLSYYADWKAGDEILARFPDRQFFSQVRDEYLRAWHALGPLRAELERLRAEVAAGEALEREHAELGAGLATLDERWLGHVRQRLAAFLTECPPESIGPRLSGQPELELAYKRLLGVAAKTRYLDGIHAHYVAEAQREITLAINRLDRDVGKAQRPKNARMTFPAATFQKRFRDRAPAYGKRWARFEKTYGTVQGFQAYHLAALGAGFLWWDLMTDGRILGDFLPEVRSFRDSHPGYRWQAPADAADEDDLLAAATAAGVPDDPLRPRGDYS
ncbi:MAG: hypothetical protein IT376_04990 [Polyangiaceae bacterium]|nr:hypothetical protein [Polyangiaceae bacterium]